MNEEYIRNRISSLRTKKNVSEYKMSLDLGHSKSYIQSISSGRSLPSMPEFLSICEYLGVTPEEFFNEKAEEASLIHELTNEAQLMERDDLIALISVAKRLNAKNQVVKNSTR
ncbi:MAG: helix-turn-helix domain-containing protein [Lachnospiraceae bacterium]|nr:helix-turn-helix domain-containing protein [Lachnospiraceae bacterium]